MKTAKEWAADFWTRDFNGPTPAVNDCFVHLFEEIQQDAYRAGEQAGMTEAAELVRNSDAFTDTEQLARERLMLAILTTRDAKKL